MKLYTTTLSANGRKALAVARHLAVPVDEISINVYAGEGQDGKYRSLNPWGKVPSFVDGDFVLWESNAILLYLAEQYADYRLSSKDGKNRADILRWLFWEAAHWQPALSRVISARVSQLLFPDTHTEQERQFDPDWDDLDLVDNLRVLESVLSEKIFLSGTELSIADFSVAGMTTYFHAVAFPFHRYPAISAWYERMMLVPAWVSTENPLWARE